MSLLAALVGQTLDDKYRIEKQLGQGGMGAVYMATHIGTLRPVALKVISPQFMAHPEFVERFRREAEAAGRLRHPNVVNVTDFGFAEVHKAKIAYLVMEYLDGCNLGDVLKEEKNLPLHWVVDILEQTCLAVEKAHQQGIIHRDLKPDNIWLEPNERGGFTVKVLDFGLAKLAVSVSDNLQDSNGDLSGTNSKTNISSGNSDPVFQEAITNIQSSSIDKVDKEGQTAIQISTSKSLGDKEKNNIQIPISKSFSNQDEKTTYIQPSSFQQSNLTDEEKTAIQLNNNRDTQRENTRQTQSAEKLTQVGAVLGTPLYMSPEQCMGEELDKRSDIYSLGIIAYEMLAGELPFSGNLNALIMSHLTATPPPLEEKRPDIPKAVVDLIMSALNKKVEERPISAAAFASALRARSESAGAVIRQVLGIYGEHFTTFFQFGLIASLPIIATAIISLSQAIVIKTLPGNPFPKIAFIFVLLFNIIGLVLSQALQGGVSLPILAQILITPLKDISIKPAFEALKKKLSIFIPLSLAFNVSSMIFVLSFSFFFNITQNIVFKLIEDPSKKLPLWVLASMLLCIGILLLTGKILITYSFYGAVAIIEGIGGIANIKRTKTLYQANKRVIKPIMISYITYILAYSTFANVFHQHVIAPSSLFKAVFLSIFFSTTHIGSFMFISPLTGLCIALLYFKARQSNGELIKDILAQYQPEALSISNWQTRIAKQPSSILQSLRKSKN